jgi:hypothetical protein
LFPSGFTNEQTKSDHFQNPRSQQRQFIPGAQMPSWHAYLAEPTMRPGLEILITGGTEVVRLVTGDQVTIQASDSSRQMAVVIERTGEQLMLGFPDGKVVRLAMASDEGFSGFHLSEGFSRQSWVIVT